MKKILVLALLLAFLSCDKDEDNTTPEPVQEYTSVVIECKYYDITACKAGIYSDSTCIEVANFGAFMFTSNEYIINDSINKFYLFICIGGGIYPIRIDDQFTISKNKKNILTIEREFNYSTIKDTIDIKNWPH